MDTLFFVFDLAAICYLVHWANVEDDKQKNRNQ